MSWLVFCIAGLALLPAVNTLLNALRLQVPPLSDNQPRIAILIPARNEEASIGECVDAALASTGADIEVFVLDDGSTDRTCEIVRALAAMDSRLHIAPAPPLPGGMKGKAFACHVLSQMTDRPYLLFLDADVRIEPTAAARLVPPVGMDLMSGVPRQITGGLIETAIIPMINSLIYGYLPIGLMREQPKASLAVACGQLIMVRSQSYHHCGGHAAIAAFMHDGMQLAKLFRRLGFRTDLIDATHLAHCRMYDRAQAVFDGFTKNATEGMARPVALPLWTVLLFGGQTLPFILIPVLLSFDRLRSVATLCLMAATALLVVARAVQAHKCRESWRAVILHPLGVVLTLAIQWRALYLWWRGRRVEWRGRTYAPVV